MQSYIDFEISEGNRENTRKLYERLLQRTRHVKVRPLSLAFLGPTVAVVCLLCTSSMPAHTMHVMCLAAASYEWQGMQ